MMHDAPLQKLPPYWFIRILNSFRSFLLRLNRNMFPGNVVLYEQFQHLWMLPSLYVAAKLDIATILLERPLTAAAIAERLQADPVNIARIMRALASQGVFRQHRDGRYALNGMSKALVEGPGSLRFMILHHLGPVNWNLMSNLEYAMMSGKDAFSDKYGSMIYDFLKDHPEEYDLFDRSMTNLSDLGLAPILNAYHFSGFPVIADIGGGEGFLLASILKFNPSCRGLLFDTADALVKAPAMIAGLHASDRTSVVPGNFFSEIPGPADLYLLKNIIHNWGDDESLRILAKIGEAMNPEGRLLIIEMVVPEGDGPSLSKLLDIQMMATLQGGKERTAMEYKSLLEQSGLSLTRIIHTIAPISLIEARKIS